MLRSHLGILGFALAATLSGAAAGGLAAASAPEPTEPRVTPAPLPVPPAPETIVEAPVAPKPSEPPLRVPLARSLMIAPRGCAGVGETFDLLIHFHGAYTTTEPQLMKSGIDAVYVVQNLGSLSGPYENAFAGPRAFDMQIEAIRSALNQRCGGAERSVGRIALSGWSAGYGAILRTLSFPQNAARVDAVLLADGMHVGYERNSHRVRAAAMEPFTRFAAAAARGDKLMAVTHSAIVPPGYASTSETARFLASSVGLTPEPAPGAEPRPGMRPAAHTEQAGLAITGFDGGDARAHCDHLYAIGDTLWSRLAKRWAAR